MTTNDPLAQESERPESRSAVIPVRLRPSARDQFKAECEKSGMTMADAIRQAMNMWVVAERKRRG